MGRARTNGKLTGKKHRTLRAAFSHWKGTQRDVATLCGVTEQYVSHIRTGKITPSLAVAIRMAFVLNVEMTAFIRDGKAPNVAPDASFRVTD